MNDVNDYTAQPASIVDNGLDILETATEGEKLFRRFLVEASRPSKDYTYWYAPQIGPAGLEPDFILFGRFVGLVVFEVKDWPPEQILSYDPRQFTVLISGRVEKRSNPARQAKVYVNALMELLRSHDAFLSTEPGYEGKLKIPIGRMVVFPNIPREEYEDRALHHLIPWEMVLLKHDLDPTGEILCDTSGEKFRERMSATLPFPFRGLLPKEEEKLRFLLWPEDRIDLPERSGMGKARFQEEVQYLDGAQARVALRLKPGHQVVKGPPGSGKTLVLVHRCAHLFRYHPERKRILLVCFNIALVSYLRRLVQEKGLGLGAGGVQVCHFFELCARVLEDHIPYENEDSDFYDLVTQEALSRAEGDDCGVEPFDAVLVDEGQDFNGTMLRVVLALLRPGGDLVIAQDSHQDLYMRRAGSWKSLGIQASGRTTWLKKVYRNTVEIFDFAQRFLGETPEERRQLALLPEGFAFHGEVPEICRFEAMEEVFGFVVEDIESALGGGEYKRSEIGVIYDDKAYQPGSFAYEDRSLPERLLERFNRAGIPAAWVSQDVRAKELFDITTDRVSLISVHSAKGLDFDLVYLVGMDHMQPTEETWGSALSLLYVAMTRAKYRLVIPYVEETGLIQRLLRSLPELE